MPNHWRLTTLGEAAEVEMGQSPPGGTYNSNGDGLPFLQGSAEFGERIPSPDRWCSAPTRVAEPGDLLVSVRAPVGDTNFADTRLAIGRGLARVRTTSVASADFLRFVIQSEVGRLNQNAGGGMFASITAKNLRGFRITLPPIPEQRRIVDLVGSIDSYIDSLQTQAEATQAARSALLADLLSSPRNDWRISTLGEVAEVVSGGTPRTGNPAFWNGDVVWVTPTEVVANNGKRVFSSARKLTEAGLSSSSAKLLPVDTVLLTSRATIGAVAMAGVSLATNQGFASLVCGEDVLPKFVMYWCQANKQQFVMRAGGNTFLEISRKKVSAIPIDVPTLAEQRHIVDVVESVDEQIASIESQIDSAQSFRGGILSALLSGEHILDESYDVAASL